jgi:phosphatidylcholine synthase
MLDPAHLERNLCEPWRAWVLHAFTALGTVVGLSALVSVFDGHPRGAIAWLLVAAVIDGVDGPVARSWGVAEVLPQINGCVLDVVVDFVNCVIVPLAFLWRFDMLPNHLDFAVVAVALFTSALWFSRTDMMTDDHWFNGFPAAWNLVVPTLFLASSSVQVTAVAVTVLAVLQLSSVKFVHPVRVRDLRLLTLPVTVLWVAAIAVLAVLWPTVPFWGPAALLIGPAYQIAITVWRTAAEGVPAAGRSGVAAAPE